MSTTEELAASIEKLVRNHVAEIHRSAVAALERGLAVAGAKPKPEAKARARRGASRRRDPEEVGALAERLHAAVCDAPGETMGVLAERIGVTVRELNRPMNNLRRAGRLRSAGVRNQTRYFPTVGGGRR